jgi:sulfate adenylyltransferase large subunit
MATSASEFTVADWLTSTANTELLRFTTAGSVDDGKSTLIGRLLYDSKGVYEDQLAAVRKATRNQSTGGLDLSLITDGLRAEREQGITIDVAYRYFSTPKRKFIIADTPGHEQYTRNMATGASTANLAIILVDARLGVLPQSRRHAHIAALLGIPHAVVAVNKMDLVGFNEDVFREIESEFRSFAAKLELRDTRFIPMSALEGDNVVHRSMRTPWYEGPSLLEHLETVPIASDRNLADLRFPVQYVIRPNLEFRGFAGQVASGVVRRGDAVCVLPSGRQSRVKSIMTWDSEIDEAFAPMSVTICLEDEIDISRGDMLVHAANRPHAGRRFTANLVWMNERPLESNRPYLLKHTTQTLQARIRAVRHRVDINSLETHTAEQLGLNEIGAVEVEAQRPLFFDPYRGNRATGAFIVIDPISNETLGAGMIAAAATDTSGAGRVTSDERQAANGHAPWVVLLPHGSGELAYELERLMFDRGWQAVVLEAQEHLGQALRTAAAAGVAALVVPGSRKEEAVVESATPGHRLLRVSEADAGCEDCVTRIWERLSAASN